MPEGRVTHLRSVSSRARGRRLGQRFRSGGAGAQLWGTVRREPIETADRRLAALRLCCAVPRAREGGASATGFDPAAPARSYGDCSARADRNPVAEGWLWRVCALAFQAG